MKVVLLTDTHIGARADNLSFHQYFKRFYEEVFFPYVDAHRSEIGRVVHLGDVFDRRKYINFNSLHLARNYFFDPLQQRDLEMDVILGNHDIHYKDTLQVNSPLLLLGEYPNIKVHDRVWFGQLGNEWVLYVPWICSENRLEGHGAVSSTPATYLFTHLDFNGFDLGGGRLCATGYDPGDFRKFKAVYTGHYHKKQSVGNIHYLGAPYEMTWADYNQPKGFHVWDTETGEIEYIKSPLKMFYKVHYDDKDKVATDLLKRNFDMYANAYLKVIIGNKTQPYLFDMFMEALYKRNPAHISVVEDHHNLNSLSDEDLVDQTEDTLTIIGKYVTNLDSKNIDKTGLISLLSELYNEAISMDVE